MPATGKMRCSRRRTTFIGGPQTPGGSTVTFVDGSGHRYLDDPVAREEGGTPAIVESIRVGLVVALKQAVGADTIAAREERNSAPRGFGVMAAGGPMPWPAPQPRVGAEWLPS
jgi:selenocysteine lyase/cysteine desulfurase